jgi:hypothetical protein
MASADEAPRQPWTTGKVAVRLVGLSTLLAIIAIILFGSVHALTITPIWSRLAGGLPFAVVAAVPITYAFHTLVRTSRWPLTPGGGLWFGALCWAAGLPATIFVNAMRLAAAPASRPAWVDPASFLVAASTGLAVFGACTRQWRPAMAGAVAMGALLAMGGGVVPIVNSRRAVGLWAGFLVVEACGGLFLAVGYRRLMVPRPTQPHVAPMAPLE